MLSRGSAGLLFAAALSVIGCSHTMEQGEKIESWQVAQIQRGKTTKSDITTMFGQPGSTAVDGNGDEVWFYSHTVSTGKVRASTVFPVGGGKIGRAQGGSEHQKLAVTFKDEVVADFTYSQGRSKADAPFAGGTPATSR